MKIIINATNLVEDRPLREADRLITMGLAHLPEVVKTEPVNVEPQITYEDLDGIASFTPKEEIEDIDIIEPIPVDRYVSFEEPLKTKKKLFHR